MRRMNGSNLDEEHLKNRNFSTEPSRCKISGFSCDVKEPRVLLPYGLLSYRITFVSNRPIHWGATLMST